MPASGDRSGDGIQWQRLRRVCGPVGRGEQRAARPTGGDCGGEGRAQWGEHADSAAGPTGGPARSIRRRRDVHALAGYGRQRELRHSHATVPVAADVTSIRRFTRQPQQHALHRRPHSASEPGVRNGLYGPAPQRSVQVTAVPDRLLICPELAKAACYIQGAYPTDRRSELVASRTGDKKERSPLEWLSRADEEPYSVVCGERLATVAPVVNRLQVGIRM